MVLGNKTKKASSKQCTISQIACNEKQKKSLFRMRKKEKYKVSPVKAKLNLIKLVLLIA